MVRYVAEQVAPTAETGELMRRYAERDKTSLEHSWEIREALGYRDFPSAEPATREFLEARAWTRPERPSQLFDQVVAWLRIQRVLLPGVSVLARLVSEVRTDMSERLYSRLAGRVSTELGQRLDKLLTVPSGSRVSELDRLRRAPTRASGLEMVRALDRAAEIAGFGADRVEVADVPPGRVEALARAGLTGDAFTLRRLPAVRRSATLLATARTLRSNAIDDALDVFAVLMASKLIGPAERASVAERLRSLPQLAKASATRWRSRHEALARRADPARPAHAPQLHGTRHSFYVNCRAAGTWASTASRLLGHTSEVFSQITYGHLTDEEGDTLVALYERDAA